MHIAAAYAVAAFLLLSPLSEALAATWPLQPGTAAWRFSAITVLSRATLTPSLGFLLITAIALFTAQRTLLRIAGFAGLVIAAFLAIVSALFVLDAIQMRSRVLPANFRAYDLANLQALAKLIAGFIVTALLGAGALASARTIPVAPRQQRGTLVRS